jgi:hypothetical protein
MTSEADLARVVVEWLQAQHWDVYQEVRFFGRGSPVADIAAVRCNLLWIIECKKSLSLTVFHQAAYWRTHYCSIAVMEAERSINVRQTGYRIARFLNVGVLEVSKYLNGVDVAVEPKLRRDTHKWSKLLIGKLRPEHKEFARAGASGGGYYTPYKLTMRIIRKFLENNPGSTTKQIVDAVGKCHYSNLNSAIPAIRIGLMKWEKDWCFCDTSKRPYRFYIRTHKET